MEVFVRTGLTVPVNYHPKVPNKYYINIYASSRKCNRVCKVLPPWKTRASGLIATKCENLINNTTDSTYKIFYTSLIFLCQQNSTCKLKLKNETMPKLKNVLAFIKGNKLQLHKLCLRRQN